ncbi:MAG: hypothetical protein SVU32_08410 [Candidatus Nanohaloarchaea archaeon]|nr:hypothetical protein [Candidatus Nanohaloarchaea archaeon]
MEDTGKVERRDFLKYLGAVAGMTWTAGSVSRHEDIDSDGLTDYEEGKHLQEHIEDIYGEEQFEGLHPGEPDLLIDSIYVEGTREMQDQHIRWAEQYFEDEMDIHAQFLERPDRVPREVYDDYGVSVDALVGEGGLYDDHLQNGMEENAHQLLFIPDDTVKRHGLVQQDEDNKFAGYNLESESVITSLDSDLYRFKIALHELGHSLGLDHVPEEDAAKGRIMTDSAGYVDSLDQLHFTEREQELIRDNLQQVTDT